MLPDSTDEESSEDSLLGNRRMPLRLNRKKRVNAKPITTPAARPQSRIVDVFFLLFFLTVCCKYFQCSLQHKKCLMIDLLGYSKIRFEMTLCSKVEVRCFFGFHTLREERFPSTNTKWFASLCGMFSRAPIV